MFKVIKDYIDAFRFVNNNMKAQDEVIRRFNKKQKKSQKERQIK